MLSDIAPVGSIVSVWRYPVKSMMGEEVNSTEVTQNGVVGDRAYALIDQSDGKVASAKNPRKWPRLFDFRADLSYVPDRSVTTGPVRITLPDGSIVHSDQRDIDQILSTALTRDVVLQGSTSEESRKAEEYWPDIDGLDHRDAVTDFDLPERTFFDAATIHLLTTSTLDRLRGLYPQGRFESRRFRPNFVVAIPPGESVFAENAWIGRVLSIGPEVRLSIDRACARCVMTTLAQGDLPNDSGILRTAAQHNRANVGVYGSVLRGGTVRRGDSVTIV